MREVVLERGRECFTKKSDIRLDQPTTGTPWDGAASDVGVHVGVGIGSFTVDTALRGEGAVGFDQFLGRDTSSTFKGVNVLREAFQQQTLFRDQSDERMGDGRLELPRMELASKGVEWNRILSEERYVEYSFLNYSSWL